MKAAIEQRIFEDMLSPLTHITKGTPTLPILGCVAIEVGKSKVRLQTTNIEQTVWIETAVCKCESPGAIAVPATRLRDIVTRETGPLTIERESKDKKSLLVTSASAAYKIQALEVDEVPPTPKVKGSRIDLTVGELRNLLLTVAVAVSHDATRYILNGVHLDMNKPGWITAVATDGRRLHMRTANIGENDIGAWPDKSITIPRSAVKLFTAMSDDGDTSPLTIETDSQHARFVWDSATVQTALIAGEYPNYRDVMKKARDKQRASLTASTEEMIQAVRRAETMVGTEYVDKAAIRGGVTFELGKEVLLVAADPGAGTSTVLIPSAKYTKGKNGPEKVTVNPAYLRDGLAQVVGEQTLIEFGSESKCSVIVCEGGFLALVMPLVSE